MAALPPPAPRRRTRPGSLDRPVNGRLYRGTWLLVGLPLLVLAFSVARPRPLPPPDVAPSFDAADAAAIAHDLEGGHAYRLPGTEGAVAAADWFRDQLAPYGLVPTAERFRATVPGIGTVDLENLVVRIPGRVPAAIAVLAHRDNDGTASGAEDNASGTAALIELARTYSRLRPAHTILFVSTDGGAFGGLGAAEFAAHSPERHDVAAALNLDGIGGVARPRLLVNGDTPRTASATLLETAAARVAAESGRGPARPSILRQLVDLGFPFSVEDAAPFISREIPALTITTHGDRPRRGTAPPALSETRLGQTGRAAEDLLATLDQGLEFAQGTSSYLYVGSRVIRGWAVELVLIAALLPFLAASVDLFARCRRRRIALAPALRSYRSRVLFWIWAALVVELFVIAHAFPRGAARPPGLTTRAANHWPALPVLAIVVLLLAGWIVGRDRLIPRRRNSPEEVLAGHTAALLCLGVVALLVVATNPFALIFVLPSMHAWLWLPNVTSESRWLRAALVVTGLLGPALVVGSFAFRYGLGWHAPWYLLELRALGYVPFGVVLVTVPWLACAAQVAALAAGRYAPYPDVSQRPRLGPGRRLLRAIVLGTRRRRAASRDRAVALGG